MKRKWQISTWLHIPRGSDFKSEWSFVPFPILFFNTKIYENEQKQIDIELAWIVFGITITFYGYPKD